VPAGDEHQRDRRQHLHLHLPAPRCPCCACCDRFARLDPASPSYEIIVVDNDAERSGEPAIREARAEGITLQYLVEPQRGIAARATARWSRHRGRSSRSSMTTRKRIRSG
jgi:hypothetical protein